MLDDSATTDATLPAGAGARGELLSLRFAVRLVAACAVLVLLIGARAVLVPLLFAMLLALVLSPAMRTLRRHVPASIAAALLVGLVIAVGAWGISAATRPVAEWLSRTPQMIETVRTEVGRVRNFLTRPQGENVTLADVRVREADKPRIDPQDVLAAGAIHARNTLFAFGSALVLCYFMLIGGRAATRTAIALMPRPDSRRRALRWSGRLQRALTRYLTTVTLINLALGAVTGAALLVLGVPNAPFLGALVALLNFVPFLGAIISAALLATSGVMAFGASTTALLVPGTFVLLHLLESQIVTPLVLGRTLTLNPLFVMLALLVMGTLWGIGGAFLAVPLLVASKVSLAAVPSVRGWSYVIGHRRRAMRPPLRRRGACAGEEVVTPAGRPAIAR